MEPRYYISAAIAIIGFILMAMRYCNKLRADVDKEIAVLKEKDATSEDATKVIFKKIDETQRDVSNMRAEFAGERGKVTAELRNLNNTVERLANIVETRMANGTSSGLRHPSGGE